MENESPSLPRCFLVHWKGWLIFLLIPLYCTLVLVFGNYVANRFVYINICLFIGFFFELVPLGVCGMLPIGFYPLMNILETEDVCTALFHPYIAELILATVVLSCLEATRFHNREALIFIRLFGPGMRSLHLAVSFFTIILSLVLPYSISAAIMCFITKDILANLEKLGVFQKTTEETKDSPAALQRPSMPCLGFYLSIAYMATLASACTITNTPANVVMRNLYKRQFPNAKQKVSFEKMLAYSMPPSVINMILITIYMQIVFFGLLRPNSTTGKAVNISQPEKEAAIAVNKETLNEEGSMTVGQFISFMVVAIGCGLVITREPEVTTGWGSHIEQEVMNPSPLAFSTVIMFMLPGALNFLFCWDAKSTQKTPGIVTWKVTDKVVPWELIFITGMSAIVELAFKKKAKVNKSLGELLINMDKGGKGDAKKKLFLTFLIMLAFTNYLCNWCVMSAAAPGLMKLALKIKVHPLYYMMPICLTSSLSFLMPTSSMSLALAKNFLNITTVQMIKHGIIPLLLSTTVTLGWILTEGMKVYDFEKSPKWLKESNFNISYH